MTSAVTSKVKGQGRKVTWCVWQVLSDTSRTKRPRNTKITPLAIMRTSFKVKRQRSRSANAETVSASYFRTSNLVHRWSTKIRVTDKRHDHQRQRWRSRCHVVRLRGYSKSRTRRHPETPKLVGRLPTTGAMRTTFQVKGQRSRSPGRLTLRLKVRHIFGTERPIRTSNLVHSWSVKSHIMGSTMTSKVKGHDDEVSWSVDRPISRERKVPETATLVGRLPMPRKIMHTSFNVQRSKVKVTRPITAETESVSYLPNVKTTNFKIGTPMDNQLPRPAITACEGGFLHAGGVIPCRPHPAVTQLVCVTTGIH